MREEKIPDVLYKYYPPTSWKYVFRDWTIRFTPPEEFNDPFECKPYISGVLRDDEICSMRRQADAQRKELDSKLSSIGISPDIARANFGKLFYSNDERLLETDGYVAKKLNALTYNGINNFLGFFCLSGNWNNLLMWSHYAQSHYGFVISFNEKNIHSECISSLKCAGKVRYEKCRPAKKLYDIDEFFSEYFFVKGKSWSYEQEYRFISKVKDTYPWVFNKKIKGIHMLSKDSVTAVIFGAKMPAPHIKARCRHIRSQPACAHVKLQRARLHESMYKLVIEDIDPSFYGKK